MMLNFHPPLVFPSFFSYILLLSLFVLCFLVCFLPVLSLFPSTLSCVFSLFVLDVLARSHISAGRLCKSLSSLQITKRLKEFS